VVRTLLLMGFGVYQQANAEISAEVESFFAYEISSACGVTNVKSIAGASVPATWPELLNYDESQDFVFVAGVRRRVKRIDVMLYRSDTKPKLLTCRVDYAGVVLSAAITAEKTNKPGRGPVDRTRLTIRDGKLPDLGTFTRRIN